MKMRIADDIGQVELTQAADHSKDQRTLDCDLPRSPPVQVKQRHSPHCKGGVGRYVQLSDEVVRSENVVEMRVFSRSAEGWAAVYAVPTR